MTYEESLAIVEQIVDRLGMKVDEKIKPLVVALQMHGFTTTSSCEGHLDHGLAYPWVDLGVDNIIDREKEKVDDPSLIEFARKFNESVAKLGKYSYYAGLFTQDQKERYWIHNKGIRRQLDGASKADQALLDQRRVELFELLDEFYKNRVTNFADRITVESRGQHGSMRLQIMGGDVIDALTNDKSRNLKKWQREVDDFAGFLKSGL